MGKNSGKRGNNDDDVGGNVEGRGGRKGRHQIFSFTTILNTKKLSDSLEELAFEWSQKGFNEYKIMIFHEMGKYAFQRI